METRTFPTTATKTELTIGSFFNSMILSKDSPVIYKMVYNLSYDVIKNSL